MRGFTGAALLWFLLPETKSVVLLVLRRGVAALVLRLIVLLVLGRIVLLILGITRHGDSPSFPFGIRFLVSPQSAGLYQIFFCFAILYFGLTSFIPCVIVLYT